VVFGDGKSHQLRDDEKSRVCKSLGITLVEVPYWWRHDKESIMAILQKCRPDIALPL